MTNYLEIYSDIFALYNKLHTVHIRTVNMNCTATLHPLLGAHYEMLEDMQDTFGEDIIQKSLGKNVPTPLESLNMATISGEEIADNSEDIVEDLYKDYEYLKANLKKATESEKNLLVQNILLGLWDTATKLCADISREMEGEEEEKEETEEDTPKVGIPAKK